MTSVADTPLAELLLARGLVGRPILAEALDYVRAQRGQDPHLSLGLFLLQRGVLPAHLIESALRHLAGQEGAPPAPAGGEGWGHVSTLEDAPEPIAANQAERLGSYRLLRKLAEGGMGAVYEVEDEATGGRFALKTIKREACELLGEDALPRLQREARLTAAVAHPQVVRIHAASFAGETPYVVQDLLVGGSLQGRVERSGRMSPEATVELGLRLAEGLAAAHAGEILHRDLKPDNVLFNEREEPVIVDFGLARRVGQNTVALTQTGEILGTPSYMAPEQALEAAQAGAPADVYALGAILFFCLEARPPFRGNSVLETLSQVLTSDPPLAEHAPPGLARALTLLMAKAPDERPAAAEVPALLRASLDSGGSRGGLALVAGVLGLLLCLGAAAALWPQGAREAARIASPAPSPSANSSPAASPAAEVAALARRMEAAGDERLQALAALDLLRLAPESRHAPAAARIARRLDHSPLATLPPLAGHRNLAWLGREQVAGATVDALFTLDLRAETLEWTRREVPPDSLPCRVATSARQAWLTLAKPRPTLYDLSPAREGETITLPQEWPLRRGAVVTLGLSPEGRWAIAGGAGEVILYDLEARAAVGHLRLPYSESIADVQVEALTFLDEERVVGILNQRQPPAGEAQPMPVKGELFLLERSGRDLRLVGLRPLGLGGHALAAGGGVAFGGGDGGGFWRFEVSDFEDPKTEPHRFGFDQQSVRRVVGLAWVDGDLIASARDVTALGGRRTELGRWERREDEWTYRKLGQGERLRGIFYAPERRLLLLSARQSRGYRGEAGSVWFLGASSE